MNSCTVYIRIILMCFFTIDQRDQLLSVIPSGLVLPPPSGMPLYIRQNHSTCHHTHNGTCGYDMNNVRRQLIEAVEENDIQTISDLSGWVTVKVHNDMIEQQEEREEREQQEQEERLNVRVLPSQTLRHR
jgi:hypothetical protein